MTGPANSTAVPVRVDRHDDGDLTLTVLDAEALAQAHSTTVHQASLFADRHITRGAE